MNLDELQSIRDRERQSDSLQQLREDFYVEVGEFVQDLREERDAAAERADDPFDAPEVNRLTDDINTAEQTVEAIYERRVGKLVKMASFAAADMPTEDEGLTAEERQLFERMVAAIEDNRDTVMAVIDGEDSPADSAGPSGAGPSSPASPDRAPDTQSGHEKRASTEREETSPADSGRVDAADLMAGSDETPAEPEPTPDDGSTPDPAAEEARAPREPESESGPSTEKRTGTKPGSERQTGAEPAPTTDDPEKSTGPPPDGEPVPPELRDDDPNGGSESAQPETTIGAPDETGDRTTAERGTGDDAGRPARDGGQAGVDRETVRITDDVGRIFGVDEREYELTREDVVTLPSENAAPLVERDVAERLDRTGN